MCNLRDAILFKHNLCSATTTKDNFLKNLVKYALMIKFIEKRLNCKECRSLCLDTVCFGIFTPYSGMSEKMNGV